MLAIFVALITGFLLASVILNILTPSYFGWSIVPKLPTQPILYLLFAMIATIIITAHVTVTYIMKKIRGNTFFYESIKVQHIYQ